MKCYRRFLLLLTLLSATVFSVAQNETKCYQISGLVPDRISKIYIYKSTGLNSCQLLDSAVVTDADLRGKALTRKLGSIFK